METRTDSRPCDANLTHLLPYDYPDFALSGGEGVALGCVMTFVRYREDQWLAAKL